LIINVINLELMVKRFYFSMFLIDHLYQILTDFSHLNLNSMAPLKLSTGVYHATILYFQGFYCYHSLTPVSPHPFHQSFSPFPCIYAINHLTPLSLLITALVLPNTRSPRGHQVYHQSLSWDCPQPSVLDSISSNCLLLNG